jgi:hypothetical protein
LDARGRRWDWRRVLLFIRLLLADDESALRRAASELLLSRARRSRPENASVKCMKCVNVWRRTKSERERASKERERERKRERERERERMEKNMHEHVEARVWGRAKRERLGKLEKWLNKIRV